MRYVKKLKKVGGAAFLVIYYFKECLVRLCNIWYGAAPKVWNTAVIGIAELEPSLGDLVLRKKLFLLKKSLWGGRGRGQNSTGTLRERTQIFCKKLLPIHRATDIHNKLQTFRFLLRSSKFGFLNN